MKWSLATLTALVVAVLVFPVWDARQATAVAATPTPAALQYDEIMRTVIPPATPPAVGTFATDYQTAAAATPMAKPPSFNPFAMKAYYQQLQSMATAIHLARYTFYKGWIRRDDPVAQTATIEKCDRHQYVKLDLAKQTYTSITAADACTTPVQPMGGPPQATHEAPGTVDLTASTTNTNLGPMTIDGIATTGFDRSVDVKMSNATGSCRNMEMNLAVTQYVANVSVPHRFCPLPRGMNPMEAAGAMQQGCKPTYVGTGQSGDFNLDTMGVNVGTADRLVMYSKMAPAAGGRGMGFGMITERGNVKWFGGSQADALFQIPAGFTQTQGP